MPRTISPSPRAGCTTSTRAAGRKLTPAAHAQYLAPLADPRDRTGCMVFPKQIVWGMKDIAFRAQELRRWEGAFPQARTLRLAGIGHYVQEEAPAELGAAVETFLRETAAV